MCKAYSGLGKLRVPVPKTRLLESTLCISHGNSVILLLCTCMELRVETIKFVLSHLSKELLILHGQILWDVDVDSDKVIAS